MCLFKNISKFSLSPNHGSGAAELQQRQPMRKRGRLTLLTLF
jgi:hypothetical protein